jgi:DNA-binding MarR family transcriptional regulator
MQVTTIGLDIAKRVFQVHGVDAAGTVVVRRKLRRSELLLFFAQLAPCLIGIEACATPHHWARELSALGHQVRLVPPSPDNAGASSVLYFANRQLVHISSCMRLRCLLIASVSKLYSVNKICRARWVTVRLIIDRQYTHQQVEVEMHRDVLNLDRYIPALLTFVSNKLANAAAAKYRAHFDIGMAEWRVLSLLAIEPDIAANRICQVIGIDKALVSRVVGKLVSQKLIVVEVDERNASRNMIRLTTAGENVHDEILKIVRAREKILLSAFSEEEIEMMVEFLHRLYKQADLVNAYEPPSVKKVRNSAPKRK